ncbi:hypothetical protein [Epiphyas postvittana nucleopolyhedrovirus]|uniref:Uncharacterized protein n=1 Tax=Epiphyas postvittana nucleopolyhedrovirus TaxID=70600 RepID=Q91GP1_NPVEP|nr:hypothetical protein [Epiphyas postvittana nucleopolyhedrovirus]AAK85570.1 unknown [Epiphyas postvittana nucleopolyhedrovirus]
MADARFLRFSTRLTEEYKENVVAQIDHLTNLRALINAKTTIANVRRFGFVDRNAFVAACMDVIVHTYASSDDKITLQPEQLYFRVCRFCNEIADVPDPDDHSITRYLCAACGTCLVVDNPLNVFTEDGVQRFMEIQRINAGGEP